MSSNFTTGINFPFNSSESVNFFSVEQCQKWAEEEKAVWDRLRSKWQTSGLSPKKYRFDFDMQTNPFNDLYNVCSQAIANKEPPDEAKQNIAAKLAEVTNKHCVISHSAIGRSILEISERNLLLALTTMCGKNPNFFKGTEWISEATGNPTVDNKIKFTNLIQGFANALVLDEAPDRSSAGPEGLKHAIHEATLSKQRFDENIQRQIELLKKLEGQISGAGKASEDQRQDFLKKFESFSSTSQRELTDIKTKAEADIKAFRTELALHEPIKYWELEFIRFKDSATQWAIMFFSVICITVWVMYQITSLTVEKEYLNLKALQFESIFLFLVVPLFFFIWVLKLIAKRYQANFHLMNDAKNREVMMKAFLSLMAGSHADPKDKILMLSSLFRPTPDIRYDDGAPVHWFDLVLEKVKEAQHSKKGDAD